MQLKYQLKIKDGYNRAIAENSGLKYIKEFGILQNAEFEGATGPEEEAGIIGLEGMFKVQVGKKVFDNLGGRKSVFKGLPWGLYLPPGNQFRIEAKEAKIAFCKGKGVKPGEPFLVKPEEVKIIQVGKDNWQREVRQIIAPGSTTQGLIIGETFNPAGNWSGTPAHKHDIPNSEEESYQEELYYFISEKPQGWGIERNYSKDGELDERIHFTNSTVTVIAKGYHQIVCGPGYKFYYLWFLSGPTNNLKPSEDPDDVWIKG